MEQFKEMQRAVWESGDYSALSPFIAHVGERVVATAGVGPGSRVLDVACGTGSTALPAALAGAQAAGVDLARNLLEAGRAKAAEHGVEIEFVEGDAEDLPFEDASFDFTFSTFGHMFAPRHQRTADEMLRVTRPGGVIGICTWRPDGTVGRMFELGRRFQPPPPDFAEAPIAWGDEDYVRERFAARATDFSFEDHSATIEWDSVDGFLGMFLEKFPPMAMAKQMLGERFAEVRAAHQELIGELNRGTDGRLHLPQEYLQSIVRV